MSTESEDQLQRWMFENINARCVHVHLEQVLREVLQIQSHPPLVEHLQAQALLVVSLLSSGLKFSGRISLQLQSSGAIRLLMADCTDDGGLRCVARLNDDVELAESTDELWDSLVKDGVLTLTLEPSDNSERWQGIVPLEGRSLAEAMESYFERSEQLPTRIRLAADSQRASALMIQRMPGPSDDADGWNRLQHLMNTLGDGELETLPGVEVVTRLFHEEDRRQFPERSLRFHCPCSRQRVSEVLVSLGEAEIESMAAEGETVNVDCEFCGTRYDFDPIQLLELLNAPVSSHSTTVH
ncbi:MAG: Hsp33 family molecular chaperone HslO [Pseudomonadota bacterium]